MTKWMIPAEPVPQPYVAVFRVRFTAECSSCLEFCYSADERANLFLDGRRLTGGPERGTRQHWFYAEVSIPVSCGEHSLTAQVLAFGPKISARAQLSIEPGFFFKEKSSLISSTWEYQIAEHVEYTPWIGTDVFPVENILEGFNWQILEGKGGSWRPAAYRDDARRLLAPLLPSMKYEEIFSFRQNGNTFIFDDYECFYTAAVFSGKGRVRLRWSESGCDNSVLTEEFMKNHISCKSPSEEVYILPGERVAHTDYWWHAGRSLKMNLEGDARLEEIHFFRTGYPWKLKRSLEIPGDEAMTRLLKRSFHTIEACSFETFMDCPYYEQLQYIADTRIDALALRKITDDTRLIEKALLLIADGQYPNWSSSLPLSDERPNLRSQARGILYISNSLVHPVLHSDALRFFTIKQKLRSGHPASPGGSAGGALYPFLSEG